MIVARTLFVFVLAIEATTTSCRLTGTQDEQPATAVLLSDERVSPFSLVCNAAPMGDRVALTAAHCVPDAVTIAIGGSSVCAEDNWSIHPITRVDILENDLAIVSWGSSRSISGKIPATVENHRRLEAVHVVGFGRRKGNGGLECQRQTLPIGIQPEPRCRGLAEQWRSGDHICLGGGTRLCPGWSGAGIHGKSGLIGVVISGTTCKQSQNGVVVGRLTERGI